MRLAQATLAEVEARLRGGEAQVHVGRWLWDVGTGAVQWSDELHRIHGVDPLDFAGTLDAHVACVAPRRSGPGAGRRWTTPSHSGRPFEEEYRIVRPDGERAADLRAGRADPELGRGSSSACGGSARTLTDDRRSLATDQVP